VRPALLLALLPALGWSQSVGEKIFEQSCATGYCHGTRGAPAGAPRLVGRGFDQAYITNTILHGLPGTSMPAFGSSLSAPALVAVIGYVAGLNGLVDAKIILGPGGTVPQPPVGPALSVDSKSGRALFFDALRGFARCSTCHEVSGVGIPVATPISKVPADAGAVRALATPNVHTATVDGEMMPALIVSQGKTRSQFYDLTSVPPVLRTVDSAALKMVEGSTWGHESVIGSYNDVQLDSVLAFLREVVKPQ
jgi:hypothetical protein